MKRKLQALVFVFFSIPLFVQAGGLMTNTNQSASYVRMPVRDASLEIDAVYFNPAGLTNLEDGFYLSFSNQTISQNREITNQNPLLNKSVYEGKVFAPIFPSVYAAYKTNKFAISFGFNPVGGGGSAEYKDGLPSFESPVSALVPQLAPYGVSAYRNDIHFEGNSIFLGAQLGITYELAEMLSFFAGGRYVMANNNYTGYLRDIQVNSPIGWMAPGDYLRALAPTLPEAQRPVAIGTAAYLDSVTADIEVDAKQTGSGFTPILGLSIRPSDRFNIGVKYEFLTKLELENDTKIDGTGLFPDGAKMRNDMPAMLSVGAGYRVSPKLNLAAGVHYYFDKVANYGKSKPNDEIIDNNYLEMALGFEYHVNKVFLVSLGYLRTQTGVNEKYQTDLSHSLSTNSVGLGGRLSISQNIGLNLGVLYTIYEPNEITIQYEIAGSQTESYKRSNLSLGIGVDFKF